MQPSTQRVFFFFMKDFITYSRSSFLHVPLMNHLQVWSAALVLKSGHLLTAWQSWWWFILDGWSLWALWFFRSFICTTFHYFMEPYQVSGAQQCLGVCIVFRERHSQICGILGTFYNPAFPLVLWEDWGKCQNHVSFTQNHTPLFL